MGTTPQVAEYLSWSLQKRQGTTSVVPHTSITFSEIDPLSEAAPTFFALLPTTRSLAKIGSADHVAPTSRSAVLWVSRPTGNVLRRRSRASFLSQSTDHFV